MTLYLNNRYYVVAVLALHERRPGRRIPYARPTLWLAEAGRSHGLGRTRRKAVAALKDQLAPKHRSMH